jgi:hypothetical protein
MNRSAFEARTLDSPTVQKGNIDKKAWFSWLSHSFDTNG